MSVLDNIFGILGYAKKPTSAVIEKAEPVMVEKASKESLAQNPLAVTFASLLGDPGMKRPSKITMQTLRKMSRTNWVDRTCITTLRDEITGLPWNIEPIDPKKPYNETLQKYFTKILQKPNSNNENWRTFIDKLIEDILVVDAGVIEKVRDDDGFIKEIYYVDGATIRPRFDEHGIVGNPAYEQYVADVGPGGTINSNKVIAEWPNEDMIYMQWNPQGAMDVFPYGLSPVEAGLAVATAFLYAEAFNLGFFRNNAIPPVIFNLGKDTSNTEIEKFRAFLSAEMSGEGGWHSPMVGAFGDGFDVKQVTKNPSDMAWGEYVQWQMRWKVALYRMSPQDIGFTLDQYKVEGQVQQQISKNKAVNSLKGVVQQYINTEIIGDDCWEDGAENLQFNWIDTTAVDPKVQAEVDQIYVNSGIKTRDEIRVDQGLDEVEGGDKPLVTAGSALIPLTQAGMQTPTGAGGADGMMTSNPFQGIDDKMKGIKKTGTKRKSAVSFGRIVGFTGGKTFLGEEKVKEVVKNEKPK
jgi:HK97 family phage portal protein